MEHKLQVFVRLDMNMDRTGVVLQVNGCLTDNSYEALFPLIHCARSLAGGLAVVVDLYETKHIDVDALHFLNVFAANENAADSRRISVKAPRVIPRCPALKRSTPIAEQVAS
ncbi:hypothetical protein ACX80O_16120 [Arthrobacter sp. Hz1]